MFLKLLKKLVDGYKVGETYFGGDVEEDLGQYFVDADGRTVSRWGMVRALYDLGLIEALPAPADGEVRVHADRAQALLRLVELWSDGTEVLVAKVTRRRAKPIVLVDDEDSHDPPPAVVRDALLLVGIDIPLDIFEERTNAACAEALEWARKAHLNSSDCAVEVPPCPEWVADWGKP